MDSAKFDQAVEEARKVNRAVLLTEILSCFAGNLHTVLVGMNDKSEHELVLLQQTHVKICALKPRIGSVALEHIHKRSMDLDNAQECYSSAGGPESEVEEQHDPEWYWRDAAKLWRDKAESADKNQFATLIDERVKVIPRIRQDLEFIQNNSIPETEDNDIEQKITDAWRRILIWLAYKTDA